ncbi:unnamed protein product [Cylindrotheca closterium]|uniref:Glutaredoxin domain-containing protein n=1 Tax=Cylindrotheca closterium TaxID=2856 RepID=A0AAD2PW76_9STRA|nr:unnamed protein product [Cylindrotheca closterium]
MTEFIQNILKSAGPNGVVVFSKTYCPYCANAKDDLSSIGIAPIIVELDRRSDGEDIQAALLRMTGQRTVPSAWVNGVHIGGSSDVYHHVHQGGLFRNRKQIFAARKYAEHSGIQHCGAENGTPCIYLGDSD